MRIVIAGWLLCTGLFFSGQLQAQDLHFTQFQFAPLTINPALAGSYSGSYRVGGIYRDQYSSVATNGFKTLSFMADAPVIRGFRKNDWIAVGLGVDAFDRAGVVGYKRSYYRITGAYHFSLDKKQTSIFTVGLQMNQSSVSVNRLMRDATRTGIVTGVEDQDVSAFNQAGSGGEDINDGYADYVLGLMYNSRGKDSDLKIGLSAARLLGPELRLGGGQGVGIEELDMRITAFGTYTMQVNDKTSFSPSILFQRQGAASEIVAQGSIGYLINPAKGVKLNGGLGMRLGDALQFMVGVDMKDLRVGVGYDMNISGLTAASGTVGAFEIGVAYYGKIYRKPKIKPVVVCPRL